MKFHSNTIFSEYGLRHARQRIVAETKPALLQGGRNASAGK
jgi:hypothetical protein